MLCVRGSYSEIISLVAMSEGESMLICSIFFLPSIHCFVIIKKGENVDLDPYLLMFTKQMDDTNISSRYTFSFEVV